MSQREISWPEAITTTTGVLVLGAVLITCMLTQCVARSVCAQPPTLAVMLARVAVAEAGFGAYETREDAAIYAVVQSRAQRRRVSEERALRDYASLHFDARREPRRWILELDASGRRPREWPRRVPWQRDRWLAAIAHAELVIAGSVEVPCRERPQWWGAPYGGDLARAQRYGWRRIECDDGVRNAYWRDDR